MLSCRWPNDETEPSGYHLGFSWTEMAIAISLQFGNWLPVRKLGPDNHEYIYQPKSHQDALHNGITLADITCTATDLWQHVQALTPTELVPKIEKGKVKSLNMQLNKEPSWERDFMGTISMRKTVSLTVPHYRGTGSVIRENKSAKS